MPETSPDADICKFSRKRQLLEKIDQRLEVAKGPGSTMSYRHIEDLEMGRIDVLATLREFYQEAKREDSKQYHGLDVVD